ncbi:MAG: hypothetical protein IJZ61_05115, partial [Oscillospiraceae bacterium]|nr:hypothetical protein [Oscillospiraceae bacterium]
GRLMKNKFTLTALMSAIHLIFVLSIVCFGTIILSLGILLIPALTSAFIVGKDVIYKRYDVYDGLVKRFFSGLASEIRMMRYFPLQLIIIIQLVGMYAAEKVGMNFLMYLMVACISFVLTLIVYVITYHIFYNPKPSVTEVLIAMFYRVHFFLLVWIAMLLITTLSSIKLMGVFLLVGTIAVLLVETVAFLGVISFKNLKKELTEEEKEYFGEEMLKKI